MQPVIRTSRSWTHLDCVGLGSLVVLSLVVFAGAPGALGQSPPVINPDFDGPNNVVPIGGPPNIITPLASSFWGVEDASVVPATGIGYRTVTPHSNPQMLQMLNAGGVYTEAWQFLDLGGTGSSRTANLSAWFDSSSNLPSGSAIGFLDLIFYDNSTLWASPLNTNYAQVFSLDMNPATWEQFSLTGIPVPNTTTWMGVHLGFNNVSLSNLDPNSGNTGGYVDDVGLSVAPEPASAGLLMLAAVALRKRRRAALA